MAANVAPAGKLTEIDAVAALETFRRDTGLLKELSFPTISGSGPNGAIVHYRVTRATNRSISPGELFLVDSGAPYDSGLSASLNLSEICRPTTCSDFCITRRPGRRRRLQSHKRFLIQRPLAA